MSLPRQIRQRPKIEKKKDEGTNKKTYSPSPELKFLLSQRESLSNFSITTIGLLFFGIHALLSLYQTEQYIITIW